MHRSRLFHAIVLASGLATAMLVPAASPSYAKKSDLTPAKVKRAKQARKSYENCRRDALKEMKKTAASKVRLEAALATCKENFPGASLYVACKKAAIRTAKAKGIAEEQAAAQCKRYLVATEFDPASPVPFFAEAGQLFFAGIGLNRPQSQPSLGPPNFDCTRAESAAKDPKTAQHLLFGNHPRAFAGLDKLPTKDLMKALGLGKPRSTGVTTAFGKVYGDPRAQDAATFFPSAACDFDADSGDLLAGLSAYYMLDRASGSVAPYFGIVYYVQDQKQVSTPQLIKAALAQLGPEFKAVSKNKHVTFLAAQPIAEVDDEGDPKNLCLPPRAHHFLGIVQARRDAPSRPEYLVVANVKNLCEFGDRLSKRLTD